MRARAVLGPEGPLARERPDYEVRESQLAMADAVERALAEERVLLCEAGTGTGKTWAYLVPALLGGRKTIVSTATKALQDQIFFRDLPALCKVLGRTPRVALMKGLGNYVCRRRSAEFLRSPEALRPVDASKLSRLDSWIQTTSSGDLGELSFAEYDPILAAVSSSSETRVGTACTHYRECFVTRMKRAAEEAELVVVNHHLFLADLALRGPHPGRVLPDYDAVIFDEAHQLEDIATTFFSVGVSVRRCELLLKDAGIALGRAATADLLTSAESSRLLESFSQARSAFFDELNAQMGAVEERRLTVDSDLWLGELRERWHRLDTATEALGLRADGCRVRVGGDELGDALEALARRCQTLRDELATIVEGAPGRTTWYESGRRGVSVRSSPVAVGEALRERLFERVPSVVLTSATLTDRRPPPGGSVAGVAAPELLERAPQRDRSAPRAPRSGFSYLRQRLGLDEFCEREVDELCFESPFDFESQVRLYCPTDLPDPGARGYALAASARALELLRLVPGGAFVLTTSLRSMHEFHRLLSAELGERTLLLQGEAPKHELCERFRAAGCAVLVATSSFWEGVDVPGPALRLVIVDKLPFPVPTDPIVQARGLALESVGGRPFQQLHLPAAILALKQGFGRLVRHADDRGVIALLDGRIVRKGYGQQILRALPPARRTSSLQELRAFVDAWAESGPAKAEPPFGNVFAPDINLEE